jgi:hypothetical protein
VFFCNYIDEDDAGRRADVVLRLVGVPERCNCTATAAAGDY